MKTSNESHVRIRVDEIKHRVGTYVGIFDEN